MRAPDFASPGPDHIPDDIPVDAKIFEIPASDPLIARIDSMFREATNHPGTVYHIRNGSEDVYLTAEDIKQICIREAEVFTDMEAADAGSVAPLAEGFDTKRVQLLKKAKEHIHHDSDSGPLAA
jgi:hypothetical protein